MAKDDIVIGLGRPMYGTSVHQTKKKAYPSVITTLGQMLPQVRKFMALNNFLCKDMQTSQKFMKQFCSVFCKDNSLYKEAADILGLSDEERKVVDFQVSTCCLFLLKHKVTLTKAP